MCEGATAILVPVREASRVADAIRHLVQHPELRHKIGQAACAHAEAKVSHRTLAARTVRFYDDLLSTSPPRR